MVAFDLLQGSVPSNLIAYLDPSAGSMVFQVLIAGLLSGMFFLRSTFTVIKQRFSSITSSK